METVKISSLTFYLPDMQNLWPQLWYIYHSRTEFLDLCDELLEEG